MAVNKYSILIKENPKEGFSDGVLFDVTDKLASWKHTTRDVGGNWTADGTLDPKKITSAQMREIFLTALGLRVIVAQGGIDYWEGQIVRLEYTTQGQTFVRSMEDMANRVKVIYTKVGPQLLTNGDVETAAWTTVGTPATIERTTDWFAKGANSMHIISSGASGDGAEVENSGAPAAVAISASRAYTCSMIVNVISGIWSLQVQDATGASVLAQTNTDGTASRTWLQCQIPDTNTATSVQTRILAASGTNEIYADGAILRASPVRSETRWWEETTSIDDAYGRIEGVFLEGEMTDDEADAIARKELASRAWATTKPPRRGSTRRRGSGDKLVLSALGMVWTLKWRHALTDGTDQADNQIKALLDESEFIAASNGMIDANTTEVLIQSSQPIALWDNIKKTVQSGGGSGVPWTGGVYPGRTFQYAARSASTQYEYQSGEMKYFRGAKVDPLDFRPGYCLMSDMPQEPTPAGASAVDDPRLAWLEETAFVMQDGATDVEWIISD